MNTPNYAEYYGRLAGLLESLNQFGPSHLPAAIERYKEIHAGLIAEQEMVIAELSQRIAAHSEP